MNNIILKLLNSTIAGDFLLGAEMLTRLSKKEVDEYMTNKSGTGNNAFKYRQATYRFKGTIREINTLDNGYLLITNNCIWTIGPRYSMQSLYSSNWKHREL